MKTELIPVIHVRDVEQGLANAGICDKLGVDKIFLINHEVSEAILLQTAAQVKERYPDMWVGVNLLGTPVVDAIKMPLETDGLWCDETLAIEYSARRQYFGKLFTGIAFKYQYQPENLEEECSWASRTTDVVVTSGDATGAETPIEKVKTMRGYLGDHPLAVASGVNAANIGQYLGIADYLLVASSITDESEMLIPEKVQELLDIIEKSNEDETEDESLTATKEEIFETENE